MVLVGGELSRRARVRPQRVGGAQTVSTQVGTQGGEIIEIIAWNDRLIIA